MATAEHHERAEATDTEGYWLAWRERGDHAARERLIEHYLPFARMLAAKLYRDRASIELEFADYLQFATVGLIEAIDRYDHKQDANFKTYASYRVKGSMIDGARDLSEKQAQIGQYGRLQAERSASLADDAADGNAFERLADIAVGLALGHMLGGVGEEESAIESGSHYRSLELRQLRDYLLALVEKLPERERLLIKYNYFNQIPFESVAQQWGMTRGRIAQLHRSALERLRTSATALRHYDMTW